METNVLVTSDNLEYLRGIEAETIDMVLTSPPYDALRTYEKSTSVDFHSLGKELHRVLKDGSFCVMVINDQTKDYGKSLTSFRTTIDWCDNIGFKLFECVIYNRQGTEGAWWNGRFRVDHEYVLIFLKGSRPRFFDKEPLKIPSKHGGRTLTGANIRNSDGTRSGSRQILINELKCPGTVMDFGNTCGGESKIKSQHPAVFPNRLALDMVERFSRPNEIVLDPFNGSGTSTLAAQSSGRRYVGIDISKEYTKIAQERHEKEYIFRIPLQVTCSICEVSKPTAEFECDNKGFPITRFCQDCSKAALIPDGEEKCVSCKQILPESHFFHYPLRFDEITGLRLSSKKKICLTCKES